MADFQTSKSAAALDELVMRHLTTVRNLAYRIVLCNASADDVTQDVFAKVIQHATSFRGNAKFSTWLYRITVNSAKEHIRRRRVTLNIAESNDQIVNAEHQRPEQKIMDDELAGKVEHAMAELSTKLRTAVVLTSIEQLSAKEAAVIEGCSTATMHWRVHQARRQLKRLLHGYLKS